jgi:cyclophilin family peptidyl-prolyl cis-trans isomerase|tara:strand:- start:614 stop:1219 length:606 start_codon:yes stop_codon:yes gene_type:complete
LKNLSKVKYKMPIINSFSILSFFLFFMGMSMSDVNAENVKSQNLVMEVTQNSEITDPSENPPIGKVIIKLYPDVAPKHVAQITILAKEGFYDGIIFHRVIEGFMAQTGDPTGTGMGGSDLPDIRAEFSDEPFVRGTLGMARSQHPDSANSQFFICFEESSFLNGQYTVFGKVVEGMEYIDKVMRGEPPDYPDKIVSIKLSD